jgi:hypothetical protein
MIALLSSEKVISYKNIISFPAQTDNNKYLLSKLVEPFDFSCQSTFNQHLDILYSRLENTIFKA